jgi:hypothetical protein
MRPETATAAAAWWAARLVRPPATRDAFEMHLRRLLETGKPADREGYPKFWALRVDYDPSETLLAALGAADIECRGFMFSAGGILPIKTSMKIYDTGTIIVSDGRGAPFERIAGPPLPEEP